MIGVVGPNTDTAGLAEATAGAVVRSEAVEEVLDADPDLVVAVGEPSLCALVRAGVDVPVVPVDVGEGVASVPADRVPTVLADEGGGGPTTRKLPVFEVAIDGEPAGRGVFEAMLVTTEPARISEYAVWAPGWTDRYRADGVVVATPAGSHGYARTVGGPVLDADAGGLAVVPVAAFAIRSTVRVANSDATLAIRVERDEGDISLLVDGHEQTQHVPPGKPVTVHVTGALEAVLPPER